MVKNVRMVKMDKYGKIFIPKRIRALIDSKRFAASVEQDKLILTPIRSPNELFGTLGKIDKEKLEIEHEMEDHENLA